MKNMKKWCRFWMAVLAVLLLTACGSIDGTNVLSTEGTGTQAGIRQENQETGGSLGAEENESGVPQGGSVEEQPEGSGGSKGGTSEDAGASIEEQSEGSGGSVEETWESSEESEDFSPEAGGYPDEDAVCTSREDVAAYIHQYGHLPSNFITKKEAQELGWEGGSLEPFAPGRCIGGNRFGNYEGLLPEKDGRTYTECDIDTLGAGSRGAKRIVFSNDGLIYYTEDHYESFELLYGEE